jgi:hypothetical protein
MKSMKDIETRIEGLTLADELQLTILLSIARSLERIEKRLAKGDK